MSCYEKGIEGRIFSVSFTRKIFLSQNITVLKYIHLKVELRSVNKCLINRPMHLYS